MSKEIPYEEEPFGLGCALETFSEYVEVLEMIEAVKCMDFANQRAWEKPFERFTFVIGQYQEQPHLLDSKLDTLLDILIAIVRDPTVDTRIKHLSFKYLFVIINTRGYKTIVQHLPHEVSDFEQVLQLLEKQDPNDSDTWMTRYVLLLWLSIIVMIPFSMSRLDGFCPSTKDDSKTVMNRVLKVCKTYIVVPDKCRDAAAYLTGRFLTRHDVKEEHLNDFFDWICNSSLETDSNCFVQYGCLSAVAMILKLGKREDLAVYARKLLLWIINPHFKTNPGTNIQKLCYKNVQRIGLTFLPACVTTWRYERGKRSLAANLSAGDTETVKLTNAFSSGGMDTEHVGTSGETEIPDEVEEVIDQLIQGLRSSDSVVRWSAAKGVGRLTARLPKEFADEVVGSILELFSPREGDGAWHGGCLALAELGRRGLLLPQRLSEVVSVILKALVYDEPKGYSSVGSHIRDAACYVCWAFARAYEIDILKPFVNELAGALLVVACFDREINCRELLQLPFKKIMGRQGTFPHGIDIFNNCRFFFAVSVRNSSYLNISVYIAQFEEYTLPLIKHLVDRKVSHWDIAIRELAAKALHNLTSQNPEYMSMTVLPILFEKCNSIDINVRHGSVLAIGEILFALSKINGIGRFHISDTNENQLLDLTQNLVSNFYEKLYFRGIGGELMRQACCDFIEKCSLARMPFHQSEVVDTWLNLMNECLCYDVVNVRTAAIAALPAFITEYYSQATANQQKIILDNYISGLTIHNQISRMGNASALGAMPSFMLSDQLDNVLNSLIVATVISEYTLKWSESRRDTIKALTMICVTMESYIGTELQESHIQKIYQAFIKGLTEYTQDNRGDIGAWVREASMVGLQTLTTLLAKHKPVWLEPPVISQVVAGVAQQAVEKIDRTRALAGKIFYSFIHSEYHVPNIPDHNQLKVIFPKKTVIL